MHPLPPTKSCGLGVFLPWDNPPVQRFPFSPQKATTPDRTAEDVGRSGRKRRDPLLRPGAGNGPTSGYQRAHTHTHYHF